MRKRQSTKSKEWGPEALVELMLKINNVSRGNIKFLLESKAHIKQAWDWDDQGTKGFPMNTANLLYEIETKLKGSRPRKRQSLEPKKKLLGSIVLKRATRLKDILSERTVEQVHEYLHEEPFREALGDLRSADIHSRAVHRIKETIASALDADHYGYEALPKPRGNWLHRQLLGALRAPAPGKFSDSDMVKLFDYFCPCGSEHNREAMKKFRWRLSKLHG
ncbi:MAG: hypothetical protein LAO56_22330 [Acidobacteriia bacterium]|nr:hypothetical protein [Terriglobia bacterium]